MIINNEEFKNITSFKNDDLGFIEFIIESEGYVYNDFGGSRAEYKKLHHYDCAQLHNLGGGYIRTSVIKICSDNLHDLIKWLEKYRGLLNTGYTYCPCIKNNNYITANLYSILVDLRDKHNNFVEIKNNIEEFNTDIISDIVVNKFIEKPIYCGGKIGYLVRKILVYIILQNVLSEDDIELMQTAEWSNKTFNINLPFLKKYNEFEGIQTQIRARGFYRYWNEVYSIFNCQYFLCSEWTASNRSNFLKWANTLPLSVEFKECIYYQYGTSYILEMLENYFSKVSAEVVINELKPAQDAEIGSTIPSIEDSFHKNSSEDVFLEWMIKIKLLSKKTADSYLSAIGTIEEFAKSILLRNINFFQISSSIELKKINNAIFENKAFQIKNNQGHHMYSAALNNYLSFIEDTEKSLGNMAEPKVFDLNTEYLISETEISKVIKNDGDNNFILIADINWSIFDYGILVDEKYLENVWSAIGFKLGCSEIKIINLQINSKLFSATLANLATKEEKSDVVVIRYSPTSDIALEMQKMFKETYEYLITQRQVMGINEKIDFPSNLKKSIEITYIKDNTFVVNETDYLNEKVNPVENNFHKNRVDFSKQSETYLFTKPNVMVLFGKEIEVQNWAEVLTKICEFLVNNYPDDFLEMVKNPLFQKSRNCLFTYSEGLLTRDPKQIATRQLSNGMWIEFRYAPYGILKICKLLLNACGVDINKVAIFYKKLDEAQINEISSLGEALDKIEIEIEESLDEEYKIDFTKQEDIYILTRPYKLTMNGSISEVHSWVDVLIKLCEALIAIESERVASFDVRFDVKESNRIYFTYTPSLLVAGHQLSNGIWIETSCTPTEIVKICKLLCDECRFDISNVEILFRRNSETAKPQEKVLVRTTTADINDLDKEEFFTIKYPLLYKSIKEFVKSSKIPLSLEMIYMKNQNVRKSTIQHILKNSNWAVCVRDKYIFRDNISDFNEVAEILLTTLKMLFIQYGGYVSAKQLYIAVKSKLNDFFFYNGFESQGEIYDLAEHLFEKEHYKNNNFIFYNGIHIWEKEPDYPKSYTGLFVKWARENNGIISREECLEWLENIGAGSIAANYSNAYNAGRHLFWQYDSYKFILIEAVTVDENWKDTLNAKLTYLLQDIPFVALRDIDDYWYNSLPSLPAGIIWSPLLLQEVLGDINIGFKTISAGDGQDINAVHAVVLPKKSSYNTFGDIVWKIVDEEYGTPTDKINTEDLRKILVKKNILQGNERLYVMHKAISNDLRFMWTDNNKNVFISKR